MATLADDLKQVPLFSGLNKRQLKRLSRDFEERTFLPGTHVRGVRGRTAQYRQTDD